MITSSTSASLLTGNVMERKTVVTMLMKLTATMIVPEVDSSTHCGAAVKLAERFSIECRKIKTKVITTANQNKGKLHNEPVRTQPASSAGKHKRPSRDWF